MAEVRSLPIRELADRVREWARSLDHPRRGMVGNLLRLNLSIRQAAKDVVVGLELGGHASEAAEIERALDALREEAAAFDGLCSVYGQGVERPNAARVRLRRQARALANLLKSIECKGGV